MGQGMKNPATGQNFKLADLKVGACARGRGEGKGFEGFYNGLKGVGGTFGRFEAQVSA